ncbi:glycosyltransferase [Flavobacterium johnsoniae]|uniref:Glycosyltransferase involved in cell wall bisynthesis n=1 Tax=Flavobacterium johnsoniae TaxID=986 RepID=A0A1M5KZW7_FLAJO|nr:glycosyltransferase [Flavobacterium johnsoniae]SHG58412.1 Glycosyltransferase involved in cell wall bisynthesis [Flavobacterium johnsoniae]
MEPIKFAVITHVTHIKEKNEYFAYAPYVHEMNIWFKYADEVIITAPLLKNNITVIDLPYRHSGINFKKVPIFNFIGLKNAILSLLKLPIILWHIFWTMKKADHIHLRCPGNMGLLACCVQILFPFKVKTAKYAGNWDPKSKQPLTYRVQKWILNNPFLTRNMKVLVYGNWEKQSKNIKPFFTATYSNSEKEFIEKTALNSVINFIFTGSLVKGKNPMYALELISMLKKKGYNAILNIYGEGPERNEIEKYIINNDLGKNAFLHGNQNKEILKESYKNSHFVILPSKSEGWPKTIAEGMFWGCVPLASKISCVPFMLDYGNRGILLEMDIEKDLNQIKNILENEDLFYIKSKLSSNWSQKYTTEIFEAEIKDLLKK